MAATPGTVTMELLTRPKGSTAEPTLIGELVVDVTTGTVPEPQPPVEPPPAPTNDDTQEADDATA